MDAETFVRAVHDEMTNLTRSYFSDPLDTQVSQKISSMGLTVTQKIQMEELVSSALTDFAYTILLGLDGAASLGGQQQVFQILDESGNRVGDEGDVEAAAFEIFHGSSDGSS